jgi:hypothetical protein
MPLFFSFFIFFLRILSSSILHSFFRFPRFDFPYLSDPSSSQISTLLYFRLIANIINEIRREMMVIS